MLKKITPGQFIALGFFSVILIGSILLYLPISHNQNVEFSYFDALFTSTSAVCVTGLTVISPGDTFTVFGKTVLALLIQIGGLGITSIGVSFVYFTGQKVFFKQRSIVRESFNYNSFNGIYKLIKSVFAVTVLVEVSGALLLFPFFLKNNSVLNSIGMSLFHSVSSFNNAGFDIFGGLDNMLPYKDSAYLCIITSLLIIFGGLGFLVITELFTKFRKTRLRLHTKVVIFMTVSLIVSGAVLLYITENISPLQAYFMSVSTRTAGFTTVDFNNISNAGVFIMCILMFIGASPGSTGGGIKTTTFLVLFTSLFCYLRQKETVIFKRKISKDAVFKAFLIATMSLTVTLISTVLICIFDKQTEFLKILFEVVSAVGTVGLSYGITPTLSFASKVVLILTMFIGRIGPLSIVSLWISKKKSGISFPEENINVG